MDFDYLNKVYANATNKREIWTASKGYLQQLDLALKDTAKYNAIKQNKLQLLAKRLSRLRDHNARYKMLMQIVEEYRIVNFPKALAYIREAKKEAQLMNDKQAYFAAILKESRLFIKGGHFKECADNLSSLDKEELDRENQFLYYRTKFDMNFEDGFIFPEVYSPEDRFSKEMMKIYHTVIKEFPDSIYEHNRMLMEYNFHLLNYQKAFKYALLLISTGQPGTEEYAYQLGNAGYNKMGTGDFVEAIRYMTSSAIEQIKLGSSEYPVMRKLTELLTVLGKDDEAYHYCTIAMHNAKKYHSMYRVYEVSQFYPIVNEKMYNTISKQHNQLVIVIGILILSAILLCISFVTIRRKNANLSKNNHLISMMNKQLNEANNIKITVLGNMVSHLTLLKNKNDDYLKKLHRQLTVGNYAEVKEMLQKVSSRSKERYELLDKIILSIFPQFVEQFNELLLPENRPEQPEKGKLTPEMRLFGLIRLGITNNTQLAESLNYSLNTIKHYKTLTFNASIYSKDDFYEHLMDIHYLSNQA